MTTVNNSLFSKVILFILCLLLMALNDSSCLNKNFFYNKHFNINLRNNTHNFEVKKRDFVFAIPQEPIVLDPIFAMDNESLRITQQIFEGLLSAHPLTGDPAPQLSISWQKSTDELNYTFILKENILFHDNSILDANLVCKNFDRWLEVQKIFNKKDARLNTVFHSILSSSHNSYEHSFLESCQPIEKNIVKIKLNHPITSFLHILTHPSFAIVSINSFSKNNSKVSNRDNFHPIGTGPYKFQEWKDDSIILKSNKQYWSDKGNIETIKFIVIKNSRKKLEELINDKIDAYDLVKSEDISILIKKGKQIIYRDPFSLLYLGINSEAHPLNNLKIRQAIAMAINKNDLIKKFFIEGSSNAESFIPKKISGLNAKFNNVLEYSPDNAKTLIKNSGYDGSVIYFHYPRKISFAFLPNPEKIYAEIARQLTYVGLNISPMPVTSMNQYIEDIKLKNDSNRGLHLFGINGRYADIDYFISQMFNNNFQEFGSLTSNIQNMIKKYKSISNNNKYIDKYRQLENEILKFIPAIPLIFPISALALSNEVLDYPSSPFIDEIYNKINFKNI